MDVPQYLSEVAERLVVARKSKGVSQRMMASQLDMNGSSYQKIETGQTELKLSVLLKVCEFLEVDFRDILQLQVETADLALLNELKERNSEVAYLKEIVSLQKKTIGDFELFSDLAKKVSDSLETDSKKKG